jgi:1-acyl-sn-glycerol-3-phosphate acyltransferase
MTDVDVAIPLRPDAAGTGHPARFKRPWFLSLVRWYARRAVASRFDGFFVQGLDEAARLVRTRPVLFCANHVSWWDAFLLVLLDEALAADSYALMDDENLARLPFFRAIGALPLSVEGGAAARRQLDDAVRTLDRPRRALWIFPQGRQRAAHVRPLGFKAGLRLIAGRAQKHGAVVVPVAFSFPWRNAPGPSIVVRFGAPVDPATTVRDELTAVVETRVAALLDGIDVVVDGGVDGVAAAVAQPLSAVPGADDTAAPTPPPPGGRSRSLGHPLIAPRIDNAEHGTGARALGWLLGAGR